MVGMSSCCFAARKSRGILLNLLVVLTALSAWDLLPGADFNWNSAAALRYSRKNGGTVLLLSRQGAPDIAFYEPGYCSQSPSRILSMTKSLAALACLSLRELPLDGIARRAPDNEPVTLRHLLAQTSGIAPGFEKLYMRNLPDVRKTAALLPVVSPPGQYFTYDPSHYESVGNVLKFTDGPGDAARQVLANFLTCLGIRPVDWRKDQRGQIFLSTGVILTPEDLLKVGHFILGRGRLPGGGTCISKARFDAAFTGSYANPSYGLGFWLNNASRNSDQRDIEDAIDTRPRLPREQWSRMSLSNIAPRDLVCMAGSGGQRVYVIPSLGAVIVRLGHPSKFKDPEFLHALFSSRER